MKFLKSTLFATALFTVSLTFAQEETTEAPSVEEVTAKNPPLIFPDLLIPTTEVVNMLLEHLL